MFIFTFFSCSILFFAFADIAYADTKGCPIDSSVIVPEVKPTDDDNAKFPTCAAFVIDLTGSMTEEISAIRQVLSDFLTSQLTATNEYCYSLVKVIGPGQSEYTAMYS